MAAVVPTVSIFRNAKSTLALVIQGYELQVKHIATLPLQRRPPSFRHDHWEPVVKFTRLPTQKHAQAMVNLIKNKRLKNGIPRDHTKEDAVRATVIAAAQVWNDVMKNVGNTNDSVVKQVLAPPDVTQTSEKALQKETSVPTVHINKKIQKLNKNNLVWGAGSIMAQWERIETKDIIQEQQMLWPAWMKHSVLQQMTSMDKWKSRIISVRNHEEGAT